ncbi:MAG: hypothetical protein RR191_04020 [Cetobacterium sp.]|uniref:hypothetical protein n=1 Tax=unclassified Cetobacterium TaxID=2630983 RepID=UPI00163C70E7|nr:hypothetical protein [Cetobacterium sp. 2A]MBC2856052.1 hypothetical protein [Cetobacterium sp. 2A]
MKIMAEIKEKINELEEKLKFSKNPEEQLRLHKFLDELKEIDVKYENEDDKIKAVEEMKRRDPNYNWNDVKQV